MKRQLRFWLWNAEELVFVILAMSAIMTVLFSLLGGSNSLWMCGVFILVCLGFWMASNGAQANKLLSISLMFSSTRRSSFLGMQVMMFAVLAQVELVQLLLLLQPFGNRRLQGMIVCYTPVMFLLMAGFGYLISILEKKNEKIHKVVLTVFLACLGGMVGLSSAWLAGEGSGSRGIARTVDKIFGGSVYAAIVCAAFVVYMLGAVCYRRIALRMDIQI